MSKGKIKEFNEILDAFLIQISPIVGTTYRYNFNKVIKVNSSLPIQKFLVYAIPMRDKILNRDETYFTENDGSDKFDVGDKLNEIIKLQGIYSELDPTSKSNIWDIFQSLLILCEEYVSLNKSKYKKFI
jgi:hypothetical protein